MSNKEKLTAAEEAMVDFCMTQMEGMSDAEWRQHGFRLSTYERACHKVGKGFAAPSQPEGAEDEPDAADEWRRLALQFDGHRIQALWHLKALLVEPEKHLHAAARFIAAPPLSGEQVLADRIAALAGAAAPDERSMTPEQARDFVRDFEVNAAFCDEPHGADEKIKAAFEELEAARKRIVAALSAPKGEEPS